MTTAVIAPVTPERIYQFAWGFAPPLILEAATRLKVFDVLDDGPKTIQETADATKASVRGLTALMDALVGLNLLARRGPRYGLTPESSAFLVSTKPAFQVRFSWQPDSIAFWDNRAVQHIAMWDYFPQVRSGYRVTIKGDRPY